MLDRVCLEWKRVAKGPLLSRQRAGPAPAAAEHGRGEPPEQEATQDRNDAQDRQQPQEYIIDIVPGLVIHDVNHPQEVENTPRVIPASCYQTAIGGDV